MASSTNSLDPQKKGKYVPKRQNSIDEDFYIDLIPLLQRLNNPEIVCKVRLEERHNSYGVVNYGEMLQLLNPSDGDNWDIFCPGYSSVLPRFTPFDIDEVHGVMLTPNGNHKIAVSIVGHARDPSTTQKDIDNFVQTYARSHKFSCRWIGMERFNQKQVQEKCDVLKDMFGSFKNNGTWGVRRKKIFFSMNDSYTRTNQSSSESVLATPAKWVSNAEGS